MRQAYESTQESMAPDIRIRCPHCFQIFLAFRREIKKLSPQFQCSVCEKNFWIHSHDLNPSSMQREIGGHGMSHAQQVSSVSGVESLSQKGWPEPTQDQIILGHIQEVEGVSSSSPEALKDNYGSVKSCPKCSQKVSVGEQECPHCGVVFIKMIEDGTMGLHLKALWAKVLRFWHDETIHDRFLFACHKHGELIYGISCYGRMLKENHSRKKAQEMIKRLEALTWFFKEDPAFPYFNWQALITNITKALKSYAFDALLLTIMLCFLIFIFS